MISSGTLRYSSKGKAEDCHRPSNRAQSSSALGHDVSMPASLACGCTGGSSSNGRDDGRLVSSQAGTTVQGGPT